MRRGLKLRNYEITKLPISQRGYMMITLMLALALMTIALLTVLPAIRQQILRDREEEMVHRGTAYMRAIQHFYKKFGRYPSRVEELENTNNLRFLRKRYTDPMNRDPVTGKERDFKFLHQQDISLNNGPVLGQTPGQSGSVGQSGFGGAQGGSGGVGGLGAQPQTGSSGAQTPASGDSGNSTSGGTSDSGGNSNSPGSSSSDPNAGNAGSGFNGPTFGGGPILGVASTNKKDKTIRVFYGKSHYNEWLFIYLPAADRGGLLTGPINPGVQTGMGGLTPGLMGGATGGQGGFGQAFGQGSTPNGGQNQGFQTQTPQTPAPTPQQ
jgi:type II secretory pathway pseudopilin PulG